MNYLTILRGAARIIALLLVFSLLGSAYAQDPVQIVYWGQTSGPQWESAIEEMIANFEAANPGIEIVNEVIEFNVMRDIAKPTIEAGEGPDLIYYDAGPAYAGLLADAGLLLSLEEAYDAYNWNERLLPSSRATTSYKGVVYGVGHELETQGLYWNKTIFAEEGLETAATFAELLELCGIFRERGYDTPMAVGWGSPMAFPLAHNWYNVLNNYVSVDTIAAAISGEHPWNDPEIVRSMELVAVDMVEAGCYSDDAHGLSFLDGNLQFYAGLAPMQSNSTWVMQFLTTPDLVQDDIGFGLWPPIEGRPQGMIQLYGSAWFVVADTEHPEETISFLDYLVSEENVRLWVERVGVPPSVAGIDYNQFDLAPVFRDFTNLLSNWDGAVGYHLDVLTPENFNSAMWEDWSDLPAGRMTAQEHADRLQAEMQKAVSEGRNADITP
jgi:raffinose/stachyose/melibiose transport system substrate-binding protein